MFKEWLEGKRTQINIYIRNIACMVFVLKSTGCPVYFAYVGYVLVFEKVPYVQYILDMLCGKCVMKKNCMSGICWRCCSYGVCFKKYCTSGIFWICWVCFVFF